MFSPGSPGPLLFLGFALVLVCTTNTSADAQGSQKQKSLIANPTSFDFGTVQVGNSASVTGTITNPTNRSVSISQAIITGSGFELVGLNTPLTLESGHSYSFQASFSPKSAGNATGSVSILSSISGAMLTIPLSASGMAAGKLTISPATLSFGSVPVGSSSSLRLVLAAGSSKVTVSSASSTSSEFSVNGLSLPLTLAAGQSISFSVKFAPQASGSAAGKISFNNNGSSFPIVAGLSGNGMTASQHYVSLSWRGSSAPAGYNVYRSTKSGGPYAKLNSVFTNSFIDTTVQAGLSYYYVTTAVNTNGTESVYSNQVQAVIPRP
jgi:Abnormal spindle-like microcephaly-assoc'd, ASPM-SPD-2-Hydin